MWSSVPFFPLSPSPLPLFPTTGATDSNPPFFPHVVQRPVFSTPVFRPVATTPHPRLQASLFYPCNGKPALCGAFSHAPFVLCILRLHLFQNRFCQYPRCGMAQSFEWMVFAPVFRNPNEDSFDSPVAGCHRFSSLLPWEFPLQMGHSPQRPFRLFRSLC